MDQCISGHTGSFLWADFIRAYSRPEGDHLPLRHILNPENLTDIQLGIRISGYLEVIPDFPALAALCQQQGLYAGILRQELQHREIVEFGYDLAQRHQVLLRTRLDLLREVWAIDRELLSHRPFRQWFGY